jgi:hypothetical protein
MTTAIRQLIVTQLDTLFKSILAPTDGWAAPDAWWGNDVWGPVIYNTNLGNNIFWWRDLEKNPFQLSELPGMVCRDTNQTTVRAVGQHEHTLTIEGVIMVAAADSGETARYLIADITTAIGSNCPPNVCLGGYAQDIGPLESEVFDVQHEGKKGFGVSFQFPVQFCTAPFNPYTQA